MSLARVVVVLFALLGAIGCAPRAESCLGEGAEDGCRVRSPCDALAFSCDDSALEVRVLEAGDVSAAPSTKAVAAAGDVRLSNGAVTVVISAIGHAYGVDPNGGVLVDLTPRGGIDGLNGLWQATGPLAADAIRYTALEVIDEAPDRVAVQARGTLEGHPEVRVATRYELRPCDPGVRIRTELQNGSPDARLFALGDGFPWEGQTAPFTPERGGGFAHILWEPETVSDAFRSFPFLAAPSSLAPQSSYADTSCREDRLVGFHSPLVSAAGLGKTVVPSRGLSVLERFLSVARGPDVASAAEVAFEVRRQLHGQETVTLSGSVVRFHGAPLGTQPVEVLVREGTLALKATQRIGWTQVVLDASGAFQARVPRGVPLVVEARGGNQRLGEQEVAALEADATLPPFVLPAIARASVLVLDAATGQGVDAELFFHAADSATRTSDATFHAQSEPCEPWLGPARGGSPACNRVLAVNGLATVDLPIGRYDVYAFKGPFWTLGYQRVSLPPTEVGLTFILRRLALQPAGTVSADLHVHGAASTDSAIPEEDRVRSFSTGDVQVVVATDHDQVHDYGPMVRQLGLENRVTVISGVETTGQIPFLAVPGRSGTRTIGGYGFWPLAFDPAAAHGGGPLDERLEPGALFARLMGAGGVRQLHHPWAEPVLGRDRGFPRAIGFSALVPLPEVDDGTAQGLFVRTPEGAESRNDAHHALEVMSGVGSQALMAGRALWFALLNQGRLYTGTANSDSHGLHDQTVGLPRNLVTAATAPGPGFDEGLFDAAIRDGHVLGTNGPVIEATLDAFAQPARGYGLAPVRPAFGARLHLKVSAAPWVPVDEVRIVVNGKLARTISGASLTRPVDPLGDDGLVRYQADVLLSGLLPVAGKDAWLVVEAGTALPLVADLGGPNGAKDGIPDTSDTNADGVVDTEDVVPEGAGSGPLESPPMPTRDTASLFHYARVVVDGFPYAFTNPFVLDVDGNGRFDPPGLPAAP